MRTLKKNILIILLFTLILSLTSCKDNSIDSEENRELVMNSYLYSLTLDTKNISANICGSWLAVKNAYDENNEAYWRIVGCSEEEITNDFINNLDILIVISTTQNQATYKDSSGNTSTGSSQMAYIKYYNAKTGAYYGQEMTSAGKLPSSASSTPNYTVSNSTLRKIIEERFSYGLDPDYDLDNYVFDGDVLADINVDSLKGFSVPPNVRVISEEAGKKICEISGLYRIVIPSSVEVINLPNLKKWIIIGVDKGSYAESYAIENGYVYYYLDTLEAYLPEGVTEYDNISFQTISYLYIHVPDSVTYIRDGAFSSNYAPFVVNPGSYAHNFVTTTEHKHAYLFEGDMETIYMPEGMEYCFLDEEVVKRTKNLYTASTIISISDQVKGYLTKYEDLTFYVHSGSYYESFVIENNLNYVLY